MIAKNTSIPELNKALSIISQHYGNNIRWNREPEYMPYGSKRIRFTLRVKSSKGPGAKISKCQEYFGKKARRTTAACWHVHGYFFEALISINNNAIIQSSTSQGPIKIYMSESGHIVGNWQDWNIGSMMYPVYYSESCDCDE